MNIQIDILLLKTLFGGLAALGFGLLFNIPPRSYAAVLAGGALAIALRTLLIPVTGDEVAWLLAALLAGIWGVRMGALLKTPVTIVAVPSVITMIPGAPFHRAILGLISLNHVSPGERQEALLHIFEYGLKACILTLALAVGVSIPNIVARHLRDGKERRA